jgi:hypothetical protein
MFFEDGDRRDAYHARTLFPDAKLAENRVEQIIRRFFARTAGLNPLWRGY